MQKVYCRSIRPDGYGEGVVPEMEEPRFDYDFPPDGPTDAMLASAQEDFEGHHDIWFDKLASLPVLYLIHPDLGKSNGIGWLVGEWEEGWEVWCESGWYACSKEEHDNGIGRGVFNYRKIIVAKRQPPFYCAKEFDLGMSCEKQCDICRKADEMPTGKQEGKDEQYGISAEADFEKGTWTFLMDQPFHEGEAASEDKVDENGDPTHGECWCDTCKEQTNQAFSNDGMVCVKCGITNPFGNCNEDQFAEYISRIIKRNGLRDKPSLDKYFSKQKESALQMFDELAQKKSPKTIPATPQPVTGEAVDDEAAFNEWESSIPKPMMEVLDELAGHTYPVRGILRRLFRQAASRPSDAVEKDEQYGTSFEADFENNTWTFLMDQPFHVMAGRFKIIPLPLPTPPTK